MKCLKNFERNWKR